MDTGAPRETAGLFLFVSLLFVVGMFFIPGTVLTRKV